LENGLTDGSIEPVCLHLMLDTPESEARATPMREALSKPLLGQQTSLLEAVKDSLELRI
jgi:hypothetical protein